MAGWPTPRSSSDWADLTFVLAFAAFALILGFGIFVLKALAHPVPPPPPPGEMRKVNLRYRCSICGAEVRMTLAGDELPDPPRHCLDDMDLVSPID